jgi:hypothetical protein
MDSVSFIDLKSQAIALRPEPEAISTVADGPDRQPENFFPDSRAA